MAATKFGVIYSIANAHVRRYHYGSTDAELTSALCAQGEAIVPVSIGPYVSTAAWQAAINTAVTAAAGKAPGSPRCCVINGLGQVTSVIMADPTVDSIPGMTLVLSAVAGVGWTWTLVGGFVAPAVVA